MRIRSVCPACGQRLPRSWYYKCSPHKWYPCPKCSATIRFNPKWERIGSAPFSVTMALALAAALFGFITWPFAIAVVLAAIAGGWLVFPFITVFDLVGEPNQGDASHAEGEEAVGRNTRP